MKIPRRRDQTKVGAVKKSFPNFRLVIRLQDSRILRLKSSLGTHRFQRAGVESGPIVDKSAVEAGCARLQAIFNQHKQGDFAGRLIPINASFAKSARRKRCVPRDFPQELLCEPFSLSYWSQRHFHLLSRLMAE
jgi:hypothetical protein